MAPCPAVLTWLSACLHLQVIRAGAGNEVNVPHVTSLVHGSVQSHNQRDPHDQCQPPATPISHGEMLLMVANVTQCHQTLSWGQSDTAPKQFQLQAPRRTVNCHLPKAALSLLSL